MARPCKSLTALRNAHLDRQASDMDWLARVQAWPRQTATVRRYAAALAAVRALAPRFQAEELEAPARQQTRKAA